ncbi:14612_t:CDS:2, partial [Cetraspora pellucida]
MYARNSKKQQQLKNTHYYKFKQRRIANNNTNNKLKTDLNNEINFDNNKDYEEYYEEKISIKK